MSAVQLSPDLTGQSLPLYVISDTDKRGSIVLASALAVAFIGLTLIIRAYIQLSLNEATWLRDDTVTAVATVRAARKLQGHADSTTVGGNRSIDFRVCSRGQRLRPVRYPIR